MTAYFPRRELQEMGFSEVAIRAIEQVANVENKVDSTRTLTAGTGLTGGGSLDANRTLAIAANGVTYALLQDVTATSRVLGRKSSGAGDPEELTLSEVLDFIGSAAQGDILYRGASAWARLGAGTSGHFLKTLGPGANPAWAAVSPQTKGAWTPAIQFGGASVGLTYTVQVGQYVRTGDLVTATAHVTVNAKGSSTGAFTIAGLPFTSRNVTNYMQAGCVGYGGFAAAKAYAVFVNPNTTAISFIDVTNNAVADDVDVNPGSEFIITITYECEP